MRNKKQNIHYSGNGDDKIPKLIFKQWLYAPNRKGTAQAVSGYIGYVATREGVELGVLPQSSEAGARDGCNLPKGLCLEEELEVFEQIPDQTRPEQYIRYIAMRPGTATEGQPHGLFGKLSAMRGMGDIADLPEVQRYSEQLARAKTTFYNSVLSLTEEDADKKGITTRQDWAELVEENVGEIARKMGIPPRSLEWVAAVHLEQGHPHVHLTYWDREQKIGVNFIQPELSNEIRKALTKNIFREEIAELLQEKDRLHGMIMGRLEEEPEPLLQNPRNVFYGMPLEEIYKLTQPGEECGKTKILNRRIADRYLAEFMGDMLKLEARIRTEYPKGALKYQYLPQQLKDAVDRLSKRMVDRNPDMTREVRRYLDTARAQAEIYGGNENIERFVRETEKKLYKDIGNKLLSSVKELRYLR